MNKKDFEYLFETCFLDIINKHFKNEFDFFKSQVFELLEITYNEIIIAIENDDKIKEYNKIIYQKNYLQKYSSKEIVLDNLPKPPKDISQIFELTFLFALTFIFGDKYKRFENNFSQCYKGLLSIIFDDNNKRTPKATELLKEDVNVFIKYFEQEEEKRNKLFDYINQIQSKKT